MSLLIKINFDFSDFRHVILPATIAKLVPKTHLMTETEWRNLGIQQSPGTCCFYLAFIFDRFQIKFQKFSNFTVNFLVTIGWVHYILNSESHVVCFRRPKSGSDQDEDT